MSLSACQLRELISGEEVTPSYLYFEMGIAVDRCWDFLRGNDDALTAEESGKIERHLNPDESVRFKNRDTNIRFQSYQSQQRRGRRRKNFLVELAGGKCRRCGYRKNLAALEFHHLKPESKSFQLDLLSGQLDVRR